MKTELIEGFWRVRVGKLTVFDWDLEEALACASRVIYYSKQLRNR